MIQRGYRCGSPLLFPMKFRGNRGVIRALLRVIEHPPTDRVSLRTHCVHLPESSTHLAPAPLSREGLGTEDLMKVHQACCAECDPVIVAKRIFSFAQILPPVSGRNTPPTPISSRQIAPRGSQCPDRRSGEVQLAVREC